MLSAHSLSAMVRGESSMSTSQDNDITTEILIQIRDEMREMRASFERRFDALDARMGGLEARMDAIEARIGAVESRMDAIETRMDAFEVRMNSLETRMESLEKRDAALENRMVLVEQSLLRLETKVDSLQTQVDFIHGRIDNLEVKLDSMDERNEAHHQDLFRCFSLIESDLKKFASVANEAILHYADEMDSVREQVLIIEDKVGIPHPGQ